MAKENLRYQQLWFFSVINIWFREVEIKKVCQRLKESEQKLCEEIIENKETSQLLKSNMY